MSTREGRERERDDAIIIKTTINHIRELERERERERGREGERERAELANSAKATIILEREKRERDWEERERKREEGTIAPTQQCSVLNYVGKDYDGSSYKKY